MSGSKHIEELEAAWRALQTRPREDLERIDVSIELGWSLGLLEPARARALTEEALELSLKLDHQPGIARCRRNQAYLIVMEGDLSRALELAREADQRFVALGDERGVAATASLLSHLFLGIQESDQALAFALKSLKISRRIGDRTAEASALVSVGTTYRELKNFDSAIKHLNEARQIYRALGFQELESFTCRHLGEVAAELGHLEEALHEYEAGLKIAKSKNIKQWVGTSHMQMARLFEKWARPIHALQQYEAAVACYRTFKNRLGLAHSLTGLAKLIDDQDQAIALLCEAEQNAADTGARPLILDIVSALSKRYEAKGDSARALAYARRAIELSQQVFDTERRAALKKLELRQALERAEKDSEIHRLKYIELEKMHERVIASEKMALLGELAAGVAHEVNSPLGALVSNAALLERTVDILWESQASSNGAGVSAERARKAARSALQTTRTATARIGALVESLKRFAGLDEAPYQHADLNDGIKSALILLEAKTPEGVEVNEALEPLPLLPCYPAQLNQVFMTLLINAVEATSSAGRVSISTRADDVAIIVTVADDGRGMSPELIKGLFTMGFSTRERPNESKRMGLQLGLPSAAQIIRQHGGAIEVKSAPSEGSTFIVRLPLKAPHDVMRLSKS